MAAEYSLPLRWFQPEGIETSRRFMADVVYGQAFDKKANRIYVTIYDLITEQAYQRLKKYRERYEGLVPEVSYLDFKKFIDQGLKLFIESRLKNEWPPEPVPNLFVKNVSELVPAEGIKNP